MKSLKNKLFLMLVGIIAMGSMTSCLNDDDDNSAIDPQAYKSYLTAMSGRYTGKARLFTFKGAGSYQTSVKYDSLATSWTQSTDSTITVSTIPVNKLDSVINIKSQSLDDQSKQIFEALEKSNQMLEIKAFYYIPSSSYVATDYISFVVNPGYPSVKLNIGGEDKYVFFGFYNSAYAGTYLSTKGQVQIPMVIGEVRIGDTNDVRQASAINSLYVRPIGITLEGTKF